MSGRRGRSPRRPRRGARRSRRRRGRRRPGRHGPTRRACSASAAAGPGRAGTAAGGCPGCRRRRGRRWRHRSSRHPVRPRGATPRRVRRSRSIRRRPPRRKARGRPTRGSGPGGCPRRADPASPQRSTTPPAARCPGRPGRTRGPELRLGGVVARVPDPRREHVPPGGQRRDRDPHHAPALFVAPRRPAGDEPAVEPELDPLAAGDPQRLGRGGRVEVDHLAELHDRPLRPRHARVPDRGGGHHRVVGVERVEHGGGSGAWRGGSRE